MLVTHDAELAALADAKLVLRRWPGRMKFVLRMAVRETRSSWQRLVFFFICIAVGVAAIVALRSVIRSVRDVLGSEARSLIAADVLIATNRDWTPDARATIDRRLAEAGSTGRTETVETPTMIRPTDSAKVVARMVELKAIQPQFPIYGTMTLEGGQPYTHALHRKPRRARAAGVAHGARASRSATRSPSGRRPSPSAVSSPASPAATSARSASALACSSTSTTCRRPACWCLAAVPGASCWRACPTTTLPSLVKTLHDDFSEDYINTRSYLSTDDAIGRDFDRAENYLSLVGLVIVILGGIAVSSVTRVFVLQKIRGIAVLKCLGATSGQIIAVYLLQVMSLGLAGSLLGVAIAQAAVSAHPAGARIRLDDHRVSARQRSLHGCVARRASRRDDRRAGVPALCDRPAAAGAPGEALAPASRRNHAVASRHGAHRRDRRCLGGAGRGRRLAGRVARASDWSSASGLPCWRWCWCWRDGCSSRLSRRSRTRRRFHCAMPCCTCRGPATRRASFCSPSASAPSSSSACDRCRRACSRSSRFRSARTRPTCSCSTCSAARPTPCAHFSSDPANGAGSWKLLPVLRARVTGVSGRVTNLENFEEVRARGSLGREYTITYRDNLEANERIVEGAFWHGSSPEPEVSIERGLHERFAINVGDVVRFDILGRIINARVSSIRDVDFKDSRAGGFMFVFRPGVARAGAADVHRPGQRTGRAGGAREIPARSGGALPECVGDRLSRDSRNRSRRHVQGHAGDHRGRWAGAVQRRADPRGRGGDDEVPARVRSGGLQDARRHHAKHRDDAAGRVRRTRARWPVSSDRPERSRSRGG